MSNMIRLAIVTALMTTNVAWAGAQLESTKSACIAINCGAMTIRGFHQANEPFLVQVYARVGECPRLDGDVQTEDMAMIVFAPSVNYGVLSDDRDFDGGDFRPLIGVDPIPWTGWYTVAVSYFDLDSRVARFNLKYGRYPSGSPNYQPLPTATRQQLKWLGSNVSKV